MAMAGNYAPAVKEIEKYIKFFVYKSLQVIITSRSGERTRTSSKANAVGIDWFNISLSGNNIANEVQKEVKNEFGITKAVIQKPLWLYLYLKTAEGCDSLLECWNIKFVGNPDPSVKSSFSVYNKLTMLLKSLVAVTRSLPAYKLTRRKDKDFSFYYKIYAQEPNGEGATDLPEMAKIGSIGTQLGKILFSVHYQTKTSFYACEGKRDVHHVSNQSKKGILIKMNKDDQLDLLNPLGPAAVEELRKAAIDDVLNSTSSLPTSFTTMSSNNFDFYQLQEGISNIDTKEISQPLSVGDINDGNRALAAFGDMSMDKPSTELPELPSTPPFLSFIQGKIDESMIEQLPNDKEQLERDLKNEEEKKVEKENVERFAGFDNSDGVVEPQAQAVGIEDDFVLVEVRPAFAPQVGDAGQLYRECQNPPKLDMFSSKKIERDFQSDESITDQIEKFESQLERYDDFFRNLEHMAVV